jgi:alkanesulfonate monooxygenase SsuD/methylene tetrahydromethanopterin reductase-like flavin-dependent oxidoreductase (luciferase family)
MTMKLGLAIGYSGAHLDVPVALVQRAEELGYDSAWSAEAYGSDAITPLAFLAGKTNRIKLGTGIMQLAARTPANAAMSAASIDAMAGGGRFIAGLGCLRTADRRGLVRPAVGQALLSGLRRHHAQDLQARRTRDARRPRD